MKKVVTLAVVLALVGGSVAGCNWKFWGSTESKDAKTESKDVKKK